LTNNSPSRILNPTKLAMAMLAHAACPCKQPAECVSICNVVERWDAAFRAFLACDPAERHRDLLLTLGELTPSARVEIIAQFGVNPAALVPSQAASDHRALFVADLRLLTPVLAVEARAGRCGNSAAIARPDWRVSAILDRTEREYHVRPMTLSSVGPSVRTSARHLGRLFRAQTGSAFHSYLRSFRLLRASGGLRSLGSPLKEVASNTGFSSVANFIRAFERALLISPRRYRYLLTAADSFAIPNDNTNPILRLE